jgi:hypothetical protein
VRHLIFTDDDRTALGRLVDPEEQAYVRDVIRPALRPLATDAYLEGPVAILGTAARWSYVLDGDDLLWCVEWDPGLLVIVVSGATLSWCALRAPNPEFGGRVATEAELAAYDEDARNSQYELVFRAWDAQLEEDLRDDFSPLHPCEQVAVDRAFAHLDTLDEELERRCGGDRRAWFERCERSPIWRGEAP